MLVVVTVAVVGAAALARALRRFGGIRRVVAVVWFVLVVFVGYSAWGRWLASPGLYAAEYLYHCGSQQSWQIAQGMWAERTIEVNSYVQGQDKLMNACVEEWGWTD